MDNTDLEVNVTGLEMIIRDDDVNITGLEQIRQVYETDMPPVSPFAVELIRLTANARELDMEHKMLGAEKHHYEFAPVAAMSAVRDFEKRHHIRLPAAYVEFLTQVGNGGAGPDYGLYSLEEVEFYNFYVHSGRTVPYASVREEEDYYTLAYQSEQTPMVLDSALTETKWNTICAVLDALQYHQQEEEYLQKRRQIYNGTLKIVNSFDSSGLLLICSGDMDGEVAELSEDLTMPRYHGMRFEDWMLAYFKDVVREFSH